MEIHGVYGSNSSTKIGKMGSELHRITQEADSMHIKNVNIAIDFSGCDSKKQEAENFSESALLWQNSGTSSARPSSGMCSSISVSVRANGNDRYTVENKNALNEEQYSIPEASPHGDGVNVTRIRSPTEEKTFSYVEADESQDLKTNLKDLRKEDLLKRLEELEKQVKKIPILQIRISLLQEEKRFLQNQLLSQKAQNIEPGDQYTDMEYEPTQENTYETEFCLPFTDAIPHSPPSSIKKSNGSTSTLRFDSYSAIKEITEHEGGHCIGDGTMQTTLELEAERKSPDRNSEASFLQFPFSHGDHASDHDLDAVMRDLPEVKDTPGSTELPKWTDEIQDFQAEIMRNYSPKPQIPVYELLHQKAKDHSQEDYTPSEKGDGCKCPTEASLSGLLGIPSGGYSSPPARANTPPMIEENGLKAENATTNTPAYSEGSGEKEKPSPRAIVKPMIRNQSPDEGKPECTESMMANSDGISLQRGIDDATSVSYLRVEIKPLIFYYESDDFDNSRSCRSNGFYLKVCSSCFQKIGRAMKYNYEVSQPSKSFGDQSMSTDDQFQAQLGSEFQSYNNGSCNTLQSGMQPEDSDVLQRRHSASPSLFKKLSAERSTSPVAADKHRISRTAASSMDRQSYKCHSLSKTDDYRLVNHGYQNLLSFPPMQGENRSQSPSEHPCGPSCGLKNGYTEIACSQMSSHNSPESTIVPQPLHDSQRLHMMGDEQRQEELKPDGHLSKEKVLKAKHDENEISEEFKRACRIVNSYLIDLEKERDDSLRTPVLLVQQKWFEVAGLPNSKPEIIQKYIKFFRSLSPQMLKWIINSADQNGNTVLNFALVASKLGIVSTLLDAGVCDLNKPNKPGYTALHMCALANINSDEDRTVMRKLLSMGKINAMSVQHGQTPLMMASSYGNTELARLMVEAGANVDIQDHDGSTALMCAAYHGHMECTQYLLDEANCDSLIVDKYKMNACSIALVEKHTDVSLYIYFHNSELGKTWDTRLNTPVKALPKKREKWSNRSSGLKSFAKEKQSAT